MKYRHRAWFLVALSVAACDPGPAEPVEGPFLGAQAEVYLDAALDVMEFNSIRRYEIDWPAFREAARADAEQAGAVAPSDTYPAIEAALERIGDNHSFFRPPAGAQLAASSEAAAGPAAPCTPVFARNRGILESRREVPMNTVSASGAGRCAKAELARSL